MNFPQSSKLIDRDGRTVDDVGAKLLASSTVPLWARTGAVNIGLDFGTFSTKAILRARNDTRGLVLGIDSPAPGYPPYAIPSLVRLSRGRLYFGQKALEETGGQLFRSLKTSLLPPAEDGWPPDNFPDGTTPDLLVALYLSWALNRIKQVLVEVPTNRMSLNVAAPMSHVENQALKDRYLHVVQAAWQAAFGGAAAPVVQGIEWAAARNLFRELIAQEVPDKAVRRFEVLPETLAPLVSLFMDPRTARGFYLTIDMGAGTTELSVSYVDYHGENSADRKITCYADRSTRLGGDMFETSYHYGGETSLRELLCVEMRGVWYDGFSKVKDGGKTSRDQWKQLAGVLAGGGLLRPGLEQVVEAYNPMSVSIFKNDLTTYGVNWHRPASLAFDLLPAEPDPATHPAYLGVANGLSVERQMWPKFIFPPDVPDDVMPPRAQDPYERNYSESDVG